MIAYFPSPVGVLKISASPAGVHAIHFNNEFDEKEADEGVEPLSPPLSQCVQQLSEYFNGTRREFDFPMSQEGTPFQQSVWQELCLIPYGKTISYMQLSRRLGNEKAIRAVGTTNGKNKLAIAVPCHRVIGSDGSLTGYGGELWRKKWLLEHEAKFASGVQRLF